jgi:glycosyltransferase involved in cell wall biosynthesis
MKYRATSGAALVDGAPLRLRTPERGDIIVDATVADAWRAPHTADPLIAGCLAEAGVLTRLDATTLRAPDLPPPAIDPQIGVTAIVVISAPRELEWLRESIDSLSAQRVALTEILLVDNASSADLRDYAHRPRVRVHTLPRRQRLAAALNLAIAITRGDYVLLLNPDVKLAVDAVARMIARARSDPRVAAVAPKTLFWRTPGFINGVGNRVGRSSWGTDLGIGHLDLGQFDRLDDLLSASLTVCLVARRALERVGGYDEGFRAYYEDAEWSYRARLLGWKVLAAPDARAFHAFGGYWEPGGAMAAGKLRSAVAGRLRFTMLLADAARVGPVIAHYRQEDLANIRAAWQARDLPQLLAYTRGWIDAAIHLPAIRRRRRRLRRSRVLDDAALFGDDRATPPTLALGNAPILTAAVIRDIYAPLVAAGLTRAAPEWARTVGRAPDHRRRE